MKKTIFTMLILCSVITCLMLVSYTTNELSLYWGEVEALTTTESRCLSSSGTNTGSCEATVNGTGDVCVTAGFWDTLNCYSHE